MATSVTFTGSWRFGRIKSGKLGGDIVQLVSRDDDQRLFRVRDVLGMPATVGVEEIEDLGELEVEDENQKSKI